MNDFSNICRILGELYQNYREDKGFQSFIEFNDLGLPLAYHATEGLAEPSEDGQKYILETYELFIKSLDIKDSSYANLDEVFNAAQNKQ